ncbi:MAG TPA: ATP-binding protein [Pyrinomonadaceae bacterium]|nr:ATP-binding protein [Pyrinomonadaceae bacterium]
MQASRLQILLTILGGVFLLAAVVIFATFALAPDTALVYRPALLTGFVAALFIGLVCLTWLLRGLLRPYSQLIGEAKRAPVAHTGKAENEAAFVLETFQSVVAQLQEQQKELQRLTEQASERADSAERFNDRIVASMPTGLIAFDATGNATVINQPAQALFRKGTPGTGDHFKTIFSEVPSLAEMVQSCLSTGQIFRREEIDAANGSGTATKLGATVAPIDPSEAGSRGALCLITDITEVTRLREQVALKRNLESLGEMSAGLAHEFKNAMAALHGYAQFLQTVDTPEQGKAASDALLQEVRNLSEMTTAFLNFARPQALQLEEISVDELIDDCARELKALFEARGVECVRTASGSDRIKEDLNVRADPRLLRQALLNLIRNAIEAIRDDASDRRVIIESSQNMEPNQRWVTISIEDTGPGIAPEDLQKIFIPFFTTKTKGHGIGLALAHRVITEHGGTLTAANAPEGGAVFTVWLPLM